MPPKSGILDNVSDLPYVDSERNQLLPFPDRYSSTLNTNRCPRKISHRFPPFLPLKQAPSCLSSAIPSVHEAIPSPARSLPTAMSSSASPSAAPSAEYAEVISHQLDLLFSHQIGFPTPHLVFPLPSSSGFVASLQLSCNSKPIA